MLYIWHSGRIMKPARKWYFWPFLCPKIAFLVSFAQICPKIVLFLNGRHNFFCICRLARLKIYVRGLLLYFQKNKKFLKLANFKNFLFFWKYNSNPLTYIFNLARRQIQKKLCRPFKKSTIFGQICAKLTKNAIFGHKNGQKYHFRAGFMIRPLCQM